MQISKNLRWILKLNLRTIHFNFKYLPFQQAIKLPFFISKRVYFRKLEGKVVLECLAKPGLIKIGYGKVAIFDDKFSRTIWEVSGTVIFKGKADIGHGSKISVGFCGTLIIGSNFRLTAESSIVSHKRIEFGNNCLLSWDILIMDTDFHKIKNEKEEIINNPQPISIGDKVWIGCRTTILKGVKIASGNVIAANTIITKTYKNENSIIGGNPERIIKENISWDY